MHLHHAHMTALYDIIFRLPFTAAQRSARLYGYRLSKTTILHTVLCTYPIVWRSPYFEGVSVP